MRLKRLPVMIVVMLLIGIASYGVYNIYLNNADSPSEKGAIVDKNGAPIIADVQLDKIVGKNSSNGSKGHTRGNTGLKFKDNNLKECYDRACKISQYVVGWIYIDGTRVNYPVMHGRSSGYWLTRSWTGKSSVDGSIFLDEALDGFSNVSLIHGHNMANGSMFASLRRFKERDFFYGNHYAYLYDGSETRVYKIISVFLVPQDYTFKLNLPDRKAVEDYATYFSNKSMYKVKGVNSNDLLILNTCVSDGTNRHQITVAQRIS